ncbi:MAG: type VI secretion system protein TssA [Planctomycetaceae bacterium]|nr:type VI secretion system protein TssA [Planctomycetaceae bacterium]
MPSPSVLDIDSLIQPISEDNPSGLDAREDPSPMSVYYLLKDARSVARAAERQALMGDDEAVADWKPISEAAPEFLRTNSKDLEIAAYLIESLVRSHGFAGLRDGFCLVRQLIEGFADTLYPRPDEDGVETLLAPLAGLNGVDAEGTLVSPIKNVPITPVEEMGAFGLGTYEQALDLEQSDAEQRERRISQGAVPLDTFNAALTQGSAEWFGELRDDIRDALSSWAELSSLLDEKFGRDSPPSSNIKNALSECLETVESLARDKLAMLDVTEEVAEEPAGEDTEGPNAPPPGQKSGDSVDNMQNREDAFKVLMRVAAYFRKTEPHSPISYAIEQIIRWGRLPLPDLLKELINDESAVTQMFRLVGIQGRDPEDPAN